MRKVQIYIEGQRIELFNDEKISLTSSIQNVQDIAKVFTDFTQSFTIPASTTNNRILEHFYSSEIDGSIDQRIRRRANIEIDFIPFRTGTIQVEKSNVKKGMVDSYQITFYGEVRTLQDYFANDKLTSLDFNQWAHPYNGFEVQTRITGGTDYSIMYPLISSKRIWTYGDNASTDISKNSNHIHFDELFPAIKIIRIFEAIEEKYGITFKGAFLDDKRFTHCYLWLKNKDVYSGFSEAKAVDLYQKSISYSGPAVPNFGWEYLILNNINLNKNTILIKHINKWPTSPFFFNSNFNHDLWFTAVTSNLVKIYLDVYRNGQIFTTLDNEDDQGNLTTWFNYNYKVSNTDTSLNEVITFKVRATANTSVWVGVDYNIRYVSNPDDPSYYYNVLCDINKTPKTYIPFTATADINGSMLEMNITDFVSGILKQFNLTCYGINSTTFQLEPLEDWYAKGRLLDITKYTDVESVDIERIKLFKNVKFEHEVSESFMNVKFAGDFSRQYGDLTQTYEYDGSDYNIKVPFENLLHNKFTGTDLQVAYSINKDFNPYIPKPVLLYLNEEKPCSFYFNNGSTTVHITDYMPFGQDLDYNNAMCTLNFGWDNSTMLNTPVQNNIFNVYYAGYLSNMYSPKNRLYYYKAMFPTPIMTSLKLNDRLIIRDKRYIINEVNTDLTTGEVSLVLMLDFREIITAVNIPNINNTTIKTAVFVPNIADLVEIDTGTTGVVANPTTITQDTNVEFTLPSDYIEKYSIIAENSDILLTDDFDVLICEESTPITYDIDLIYQMLDLVKETQKLKIIVG